MFEENISQETASTVLNMSKQQLRKDVEVQDKNPKPVSARGIEARIEWDNPESAIISHLWLDPKIRKNGIGKTILREIVSQLQDIDHVDTIYATVQASGGATRAVLHKAGFTNFTKSDDEYWGEIIEAQMFHVSN